MELSKLIEENDLEDEPLTLTPLPLSVLPEAFNIESQPVGEPQPGRSKRSRTEKLCFRKSTWIVPTGDTT